VLYDILLGVCVEDIGLILTSWRKGRPAVGNIFLSLRQACQTLQKNITGSRADLYRQ
jgi:hypothetical protein